MKKLLLGTLLSLGIASNAFAFGASYCFDDRSSWGPRKHTNLTCSAYLSLEITLPPLATAGTIVAGTDTMRYFWKTDFVLNELNNLNATNEVSPVLASLIMQAQSQVTEQTGIEQSFDEVLKTIEFMSLQ